MEVHEDIFWKFIRIISSCRNLGPIGSNGLANARDFGFLWLVLRMILVSGRLLPNLIGSCIWRNKVIHRLMLLHGMAYKPSRMGWLVVVLPIQIRSRQVQCYRIDIFWPPSISSISSFLTSGSKIYTVLTCQSAYTGTAIADCTVSLIEANYSRHLPTPLASPRRHLPSTLVSPQDTNQTCMGLLSGTYRRKPGRPWIPPWRDVPSQRHGRSWSGRWCSWLSTHSFSSGSL